MRRADAVDFLILHYTGMTSGEAALERLCAREAKVSAHYLVEEDGRVFRLVDEDRRAWHAGVAAWDGMGDLNSRSVGVEIVNPGHEFGYRDFPEAQVAAVEALCLDILARHAISAAHVLGHSDIAPDRKRDPGERFPWRRLAGAGIGLWPGEIDTLTSGPSLGPGARGVAVAELRTWLARFGYRLTEGEAYDRAVRDVVAALQRHWRPARVDGIADQDTQATLKSLLALTVSEA
ncbi:MAG: N-acetylmuramoyl-L-alanine amidase [Alphaproteobacteria bacterium]